jgi:hypothetical protein
MSTNTNLYMGQVMAKLTFWINSFLPGSVPGYTVALTAGVHRGKTAIPMPTIARAANWFKAWNAGYLTDQRTFSNNPTASTRMRSLIEIETDNWTEIKQSHTSSGTTEVDISSGDQKGFAIANMSRCKFTEVLLPKLPALTVIKVSAPPKFSRYLSAAAGDPLINAAADIDYNGALIVSLVGTKIEVHFNGMVDAFPAYECYAMYKGITKQLFVRSPPVGHKVTNLPGPANNVVTGRVEF